MRLIPSEVRAVADHVVGTVRGGVNVAVEEASALIELVGRASALMDDAQQLLVRASAALDGAECQLANCERLLVRTGALLQEAETMVAPLRPLADAAIPVLAQVMPIATSVVESIDPDEVDAMVRTVNHLPALVDTVETQVIPNLAALDRVGPDVHEILDNVTDLSKALMGMPGIGWMQRRGADKHDG